MPLLDLLPRIFLSLRDTAYLLFEFLNREFVVLGQSIPVYELLFGGGAIVVITVFIIYKFLPGG